MPTLAQQFDVIEVIIYGIGAVIFVGSMISSSLSKNKKKGGGAKRRPRGGRADSGGRPSMDDLAAKRRRELQQKAQQRRQGGGSPPSRPGSPGGPTPDPSNMTMAERIARARAKQQYEQRAQGQPRRGPSLPSPDEVEAERQRRQAAALQRRDQEAALARQEQRVRAQREADEARRQQAARQQAARQQAARRAKPSRPARPAAPRPGHGINVPDHEEVHRLLEDASPPAGATEVGIAEIGSGRKRRRRGKSSRSSLIDFDRLSRADLRRALILKEVLDKPVALRDASSQGTDLL